MGVCREANCSALCEASRATVLIDADAYFRTVRRAIREARQSVMILAWDVNSQVAMLREPPFDGAPERFAAFLLDTLEARPELHIHLLLWDYSMIYVAEREWNPFSDFTRNKHPRLHFRTDNFLPLGASHHQKVVVVDDALAFVGGLDFSVWRWDTEKHRFDHPERKDTQGKPYAPYHDVQLMVSGAIAGRLGDLCRGRWADATGETLPAPQAEPRADWPEGLEADFRSVPVALTVTQTQHRGREERFEVERMTLDQIAAAREFIYLENQYLSSHRIATALAERLKEPDGPELVLILTADTLGWAEENTMGLLRERILEILEAADAHDRFRVYTPYVMQGGSARQVYVHAKLAIIDDRILKVGSSNLSNRSMRVDTECDLVIETERASPAIRHCLCRLLANYFASDAATVAKGIEEAGGIGRWIDHNCRSEGHSLRPLSYGLKNDMERKLADGQLLDPDEPPDPLHWAGKHLPESLRHKVLRRGLQAIGLTAGLLLIFALLYQLWGDSGAGERLLAQLEAYRGTPQLWFLIPLVFLAAATLGAPLNALLVLSTLSFGLWPTFIGGFLGAFVSTQLGFVLGRWGGQPLLRRFGGQSIDRLNGFLRRRGLLPVFFCRVLPVAPFTVVNIAAGSTGLRWSTYTQGTLLGMIPGMLATVLITAQSERVVRDPQLGDIALLVLMAGLCLGAFILLRRAWGHRRAKTG